MFLKGDSKWTFVHYSKHFPILGTIIPILSIPIFQ